VTKYDRVVPPGQSGKIVGTLKVGSYQGIIKKSISVSSNDPEHPQIKLYLQCSILGIKVLPYARVYFNKKSGESETKELTIATIGEGPLTVSAQPSNPDFGVTLEKLTDDTKPASDSEYWNQYKLLITLPETFPEGRVSGNVTLETSSQYQPSLTIPISGMVQPTVVVSPTTVRMRTDAQDQPPYQTLKVTQRYGNGLKISRVITEPSSLKAELKPIKEGKQYSVILTWTALKSKGTHHGKVVIHTNDERKPIITVPVIVDVK